MHLLVVGEYSVTVWIKLQLMVCGSPLSFSFHIYLLSSVCDLFSVCWKLFLCAANLALKVVDVKPIHVYVAVWGVTFTWQILMLAIIILSPKIPCCLMDFTM